MFNEEVYNFKQWFSHNRMLINFSITKVMNIGYICFCSTPFVSVSDFENVVSKIWGLVFNCKVSWYTHFESVISKTSKRLYLLCVLKCMSCHDICRNICIS